jgi:hypothetical protein
MRITEVLNLYKLHDDPEKLDRQDLYKARSMTATQYFNQVGMPYIKSILGNDIVHLHDNHYANVNKFDVYRYLTYPDIYNNMKFKLIHEIQQFGIKENTWEIFRVTFTYKKQQIVFIETHFNNIMSYGSSEFYMKLKDYNFFKTLAVRPAYGPLTK